MPPAPPEAGFSFSGISVTNASVVSMRAAIEAAFCSAVPVPTTLAGSTTPAFTRSSYLPRANVEPFIAAALLDFLDDQSACLASAVAELACRKLECAAKRFPHQRPHHRAHFVCEGKQRLRRQRHPARPRTGRMQGIL